MHRIHLIKFVPNQPLEDNFPEERLQQDEEIFIPQDDLYTKTWETNFCEQLATRDNEPIPTILPNGEQPVTPNTDFNDADDNEVDYKITNDGLNDVNDALRQRNERFHDDVSKRNKGTEAERNENPDWPNSDVYHKNQGKASPDSSDRQENDDNFLEGNSSNENDAQDSPKRGDDIIVPEQSPSNNRNESLSPRGGKYYLRPNPSTNYSEDFRY